MAVGSAQTRVAQGRHCLSPKALRSDPALEKRIETLNKIIATHKSVCHKEPGNPIKENLTLRGGGVFPWSCSPHGPDADTAMMETELLTHDWARPPGTWLLREGLALRAGAIRSPLHGPLCLMGTKALVAAYVCPVGRKCHCSHLHDLYEIVVDTSWPAI